jgi:hypothetical protein
MTMSCQATLFGGLEPVKQEKQRVHKPHDYPNVRREVVNGQVEKIESLMYAEELRDLARLRPSKRSQCDARRMEIYTGEALPIPEEKLHEVRREMPCPWLGCRFHLAMDLEEKRVGGRKKHVLAIYEDVKPEHSCVLDEIEAAGGGQVDEAIGQILGCSDEWARLAGERALKRLRNEPDFEDLDDYEQHGETPEWRWK